MFDQSEISKLIIANILMRTSEIELYRPLIKQEQVKENQPITKSHSSQIHKRWTSGRKGESFRMPNYLPVSRKEKLKITCLEFTQKPSHAKDTRFVLFVIRQLRYFNFFVLFQKFKIGTDKNPNLSWFGPIDDEDQQEEIYDYCNQLFKANFKTDAKFDSVAYLFEVWVPEVCILLFLVCPNV